MIPFIGSLFKVDRLTIYGIVASGVSLVEIYALSGASFDNFTIGYLWSVLCALMYAVSVVYLSYETRKDHRSEAFEDLRLLIILQVAFGIPMPLITDVSSFMYLHFNYILIIAIVFCSISTITCYYLQNTYQKHLSMSQVLLSSLLSLFLQQFLGNLSIMKNIFINYYWRLINTSKLLYN